ncbi:Alpha-amylase [Rhizoctonia solani]|uniref:Alpha-amylase n=1 Tax=Rhizoctonia solani TaxID=456999 RepID=A0A8H7H5D7_9AGAM|nr:Alpha-amylase [Rhizoctonia solani]
MRYHHAYLAAAATATLVTASLSNIRLCAREELEIDVSLSGGHSCTSGDSRSVIIQMFEWSWDSIAAECTDFIGPAGYGFVQVRSTLKPTNKRSNWAQVSPPSEHIEGPQWWTDYQPVSYTLTSKRGNRKQFRKMVNTCKRAGVGVIVDTIFNHMSAMENGTGVAGSPFTHYNYPGIYQPQNFHNCGLNPGNDIADYTNRADVQNCELLNLAEYEATETEYVRSRLATYANDLLSLGVVGFRVDAAKHIPAADIANILGRLKSKPYITQEVIFGVGEPILPSEYAGNGDVQEFRYTSALQNAFYVSGISSLTDLDNRGWMASDGANVFVSNHDTERNGASLSYKSGILYTLAHVFMLAHPYGTPTVLSSYTFSDGAAGSPLNGVGTCSGSEGANGWRCQHRWTAIAGMVKWRNGVTGSINNWVSGTSQQVAFGRGSTGFVVINNADVAWTNTFKTPLADNSYCDMITGATGRKRSCTGASHIVSGGTFTATVPPRSAIALFTGAIGTGSRREGESGLATVSFTVSIQAASDESVFVVGNIQQLGDWAPSKSIAMSSSSLPTWGVNITIPTDTEFSYKYIRKTSNESVIWESDPNRSAVAPSSGTLTLNDVWR